MSFMLRSHHERYNQRSRQSFYRGALVLGCIIVAIMIGYGSGQKKNDQELRMMRRQTKELQKNYEQNQQQLTQLQADLQTQLIKFQQLENQYERDVPQGDLGLLMALLKEQMEKGMAVERMVEIIRAAEPPQNCSQAVNKRFILSTPAYKGPESAVTFAEGMITMLGKGQASNSGNQEKEAWFDPGKPVTIIFKIAGGKSEEKTGLLPLQHTIILRDKEYRFTISEGPRSFVVVSSDNCDYKTSVIDKLTD